MHQQRRRHAASGQAAAGPASGTAATAAPPVHPQVTLGSQGLIRFVCVHLSCQQGPVESGEWWSKRI
jgi:hypothetical protein